jgi:GGDEF domain-containing protein
MHAAAESLARERIDQLEFAELASPGRPDLAEKHLEHLDRQDWQLWTLAVLMLFVLGVSLLSFMFPAIFWNAQELAVRAPQRAFVGFCVLLSLALLYMLQRQAQVRSLRRQLFKALTLAAEGEQRALWRAFQSLPGMRQFRDSLAMEFRRASATEKPLAVVLLEVSQNEAEGMGPIAATLRQMLRRSESLFRLADTSVGMILPGSSLVEANALVVQAEQNVRLNRPDLKLNSRVTAFPDEAHSYYDLEEKLRTRVL